MNLKYSTNEETMLSHLFFLSFYLKELAEQLKAQLDKANKFEDSITQISSKKSGIEVSNKSLFIGSQLPYIILLLGSGNILMLNVSVSVSVCLYVFMLVCLFLKFICVCILSCSTIVSWWKKA